MRSFVGLLLALTCFWNLTGTAKALAEGSRAEEKAAEERSEVYISIRPESSKGVDGSRAFSLIVKRKSTRISWSFDSNSLSYTNLLTAATPTRVGAKPKNEAFFQFKIAGLSLGVFPNGALSVESPAPVLGNLIFLESFGKVTFYGGTYLHFDLKADEIEFARSTEFMELGLWKLDKYGSRTVVIAKDASLSSNGIDCEFLRNYGTLKIDSWSQKVNLRNILAVSKTLDNQYGTIESKNILELRVPKSENGLGIVKGNQILISAFSSNKEPLFLQNGRLVADQSVVLRHSAKVSLHRIQVQSPDFILDVPEFSADPQKDCKRTLVWRRKGENFSLSDPFQTKGRFQIYGDGNVLNGKVDLPSYSTPFPVLLEDESRIDLQAKIKAENGIEIWAPSSKVTIGTGATLESEAGAFRATVSELDLKNGGLVAGEAHVNTRDGVTVGRLDIDPKRKTYSTLYCTAFTSSSHNLGNDIISPTFKYGDQEVEDVYRYGHLLDMPYLVPNLSFLTVRNSLQIQGGPLRNYGRIDTGDFVLNSGQDSFCEGSILNVKRDFGLAGSLYLKRPVGTFSFIYISRPADFEFALGPPGILTVGGGVIPLGRAEIFNRASHLHLNRKDPKVRIESLDFTASLDQEVISGTPAEHEKLNSTGGIRRLFRHVRGSRAQNNHTGNVNHAEAFYKATGGLAGGQRVFPANTSFLGSMSLTANNIQLQGNFSALDVLIKLEGESKVALGSVKPYHVPRKSKSSVQELPSPGKPRRKYWFDLKEVEQFHKDIAGHVNVKTDHEIFPKAIDPNLFELAPDLIPAYLIPEYLIESVKNSCMDQLSRGFIYPGKTIDEELVKELHRNATDYLAIIEPYRPSHADIEKALSARSSKETHLPLPSEPMIFYDRVVTEDQIEQLVPILYFPPAMIDAARGVRGSKMRAELLAIFPANLTPKKAIEYFKDKPLIQKRLIKFFETHPNAAKALTEGNPLACAKGCETVKSTHLELPPEVDIPWNEILVHSEMSVDTLAAFAAGDVTSYADVKARNAFLCSLFGNVTLESKKERISGGTCDDFKELPVQARIHVDAILTLLARRSIQFIGAETRSKIETHATALANLIDVPLTLIHKAVNHYHDGKKSRTETTTDAEQFSSSHYTEGLFHGHAGQNAGLNGSDIEAKEIDLEATNSVEIGNVHNIRQSSSQSTEKGGFGKKKSKETAEVSSQSRGVNFTAEKIRVKAGQGDISVTHADIEAKTTLLSALNGRANFKQGVNESNFVSSERNSNHAWQSSTQESKTHRTYSQTRISGDVVIESRETMIEVVRGQTNALLDKLRAQNTPVTLVELQEFHEESRKKIQGLSGQAQVVVAIAMGLACAGVGPAFFANPVAAAMTSAAAGTTASHAAITAVGNGGDLGKTLEGFFKKDFAKNLATAVATAGLTSELGSHLGVKAKPETFLQHLKASAVRSASAATAKTFILQEKLRDALRTAAVSTFAGALGGIAANKIGEAYSSEAIDGFTRIASHFFVGAGVGAIVGEGSLEGALSGAVGALAAEIFLASLSDSGLDVTEGIFETSEDEERLTPQDFNKKLMDHFYTSADLAKVAAAFTNLLTGTDVSIGSTAANNAVDNNWIPTAISAATSLAFAAFSAYQVIESFKVGPWEGLTELGIVVATGWIGTKAVYGSYKAVKYMIGDKPYATWKLAVSAALEAKPAMKAFLSKFSKRLNGTMEKTEDLKLERLIEKIEGDFERLEKTLLEGSKMKPGTMNATRPGTSRVPGRNVEKANSKGTVDQKGSRAKEEHSNVRENSTLEGNADPKVINIEGRSTQKRKIDPRADRANSGTNIDQKNAEVGEVIPFTKIPKEIQSKFSNEGVSPRLDAKRRTAEVRRMLRIDLAALEESLPAARSTAFEKVRRIFRDSDEYLEEGFRITKHGKTRPCYSFEGRSFETSDLAIKAALRKKTVEEIADDVQFIVDDFVVHGSPRAKVLHDAWYDLIKTRDMEEIIKWKKLVEALPKSN